MNTPPMAVVVLILLTCAFMLSTSGVAALADDEGSCPSQNRMHVFCHLAVWFPGAFPENALTPDNFDPYLCTHIFMGYIGMTETYDLQFFNAPASELATNIVKHVSGLKKSSLFLFTIGGWTDFGQSKYSQLAKKDKESQTLLTNVISFLRKHKAHGIDFMWNYVGRGGSNKNDVEILVSITDNLCSGLKAEGYLCVITLVKVESPGLLSDTSYLANVKKIISAADFVNIWTADTRPPQLGDSIYPMVPQDLLITKGAGSSYENYRSSSINFAVDFYKKACESKEELLRKIALVITLQTGTYALLNQADIKNLSVSTRTALDGANPIAGDHDIKYQYPFFKTCSLLTSPDGSWRTVLFPGGVPLAVTDDYVSSGKAVVIPTSTPEYVKEKVAYARDEKLGGVSIFHITADDVHGWCYNQSYPILHAVNDELHNCRYY